MNTFYGYSKAQDYNIEFYSPLTTCRGDKLALIKNRKSSFPKARRFSQYDVDSRRIGIRVGPGSYNFNYLSIGSYRNVSPPVFCRFHSPSDKWYLASYMQKKIIKNTKQ